MFASVKHAWTRFRYRQVMAGPEYRHGGGHDDGQREQAGPDCRVRRAGVDHGRAGPSHTFHQQAVADNEDARAEHGQQRIFQGAAGLSEQGRCHDQQGQGEAGGERQQQVGLQSVQDLTFT